MSSTNNNTITNSLGIVLPKDFVTIRNDCEEHPEKGYCLDRWYDHCNKKKKLIQSESDNTNTNNIQDAQNNRGPISSTKFKCTDVNIPTIEGSIAIYDINNSTPPVTKCIGYIVSISDDHNAAVVVLKLPKQGKVPCICPLSLIDESAIEVVRAGEFAKILYMMHISCLPTSIA